MNKNLLKFGGMAIVAIAMASCAKTDLYDENSEILISQHKSDYQANFVKKYGEVDPNKSWDMSSHQPHYSLTSMFDAPKASTRTTDTYSKTKKAGFTIEKDVLTWFFKNTPAGKNNQEQGNPFSVMITPAEFTIIPIFQGNASYYWQLWMRVEGVANDIKIWDKGEDLSYRKNGNLINAGTGQDGVDRDADEVVAPAITFSGLPEGKMHFYLKKWNNAETFENDVLLNKYTTASSLKRKMLAMDNCPRPSCVPSGASYKIIGCEDASDNDYEDLAFLIYGNFSIEEVRDVYETIPKRYMVEDLGATDDFDFNDVVIDLFNEYKTTYKYTTTPEMDNELTGTEGPVLTKQWAIVRAAGGTLDFTIKIGQNNTWKKSDHVKPSTTMVNTGVNGAIDYQNYEIDKFEIKNKEWDSVNDNVSIEVDGKDKNLGVYYIPFPKEGEIPMIIAVDTSVTWMFERNGVPNSWITNPPVDENPQPNPGGSR